MHASNVCPATFSFSTYLLYSRHSIFCCIITTTAKLLGVIFVNFRVIFFYFASHVDVVLTFKVVESAVISFETVT